MNEWVAICAVAELLPGQWKSGVVNNFEIVVFNFDGTVFAVEACCTVDGAKLKLECDSNGILVCPHNGARFDVRSGVPLVSPPFEPLAKFSTRVRNGIVEVHREPWF